MDLNIDERITKISNQLKKRFVSRIPLRYFTNLGKINFLLKIDFRIKCHLETDMKELFKSKKLYGATDTFQTSPDAKIIFTKAPFIQYKQILLDKNFIQYLQTIMVSKKILRMGVQKHPFKRPAKLSGTPLDKY